MFDAKAQTTPIAIGIEMNIDKKKLRQNYNRIVFIETFMEG